MEPRHKVATPRKEVREGRSFNPREFAITLEQVVSARGPRDVFESDDNRRVQRIRDGMVRC